MRVIGASAVALEIEIAREIVRLAECEAEGIAVSLSVGLEGAETIACAVLMVEAN